MTREHPHEHDPGTQRIEAFSDGVFAIAITLLIIEIGVPRLQGGESLAHALGDLWPSYGAYVLSFLMIGIYWANHHAFFKLFVRTDHVFLMLNVFFLMCIAFLPFPTAVLGDYLDNADERQAAASFYALGLLLPAFGWLTVWLYACWHGLTDERLHPSFVRSMTVQYLLSNACYAVALAVSFASTFAGLAICVAITLLYLLPPRQPRYID
jgi:uncharacterized membrane protein